MRNAGGGRALPAAERVADPPPRPSATPKRFGIFCVPFSAAIVPYVLFPNKDNSDEKPKLFYVGFSLFSYD
jgi:hypothetical protein